MAYYYRRESNGIPELVIIALFILAVLIFVGVYFLILISKKGFEWGSNKSWTKFPRVNGIFGAAMVLVPLVFLSICLSASTSGHIRGEEGGSLTIIESISTGEIINSVEKYGLSAFQAPIEFGLSYDPFWESFSDLFITGLYLCVLLSGAVGLIILIFSGLVRLFGWIFSNQQLVDEMDTIIDTTIDWFKTS